MKRRRWLQEYRCSKFATNIVAKLSYCHESFEKCKECPYKTILPRHKRVKKEIKMSKAEEQLSQLMSKKDKES